MSNLIIIKLTSVTPVRMFVQNSCCGSDGTTSMLSTWRLLIIESIYRAVIISLTASRLSVKDLGTDVGADT